MKSMFMLWENILKGMHNNGGTTFSSLELYKILCLGRGNKVAEVNKRLREIRDMLSVDYNIPNKRE